MNLPMQPDEVRAFVKRVGITIRPNDWTGMWKRKTDKKRRTTPFASEEERRRTQSEQCMRNHRNKKSGICACNNPATVKTNGNGASFVCDRCLRLERAYYDHQHRKRRIGRQVVEEVEKE